MSRKPSVIMSAAERKTAQSDLKVELARAKDLQKAAKADIKQAEAQLKALAKNLEVHNKAVLGLQTRVDALKPAKKTAESLGFQRQPTMG